MGSNVGFTSPFIPPEWIESHGLTPLRIVPDGEAAPSGSSEGQCPYAAAYTAEALGRRDLQLVIFCTTCDQMRRAADTFQLECDTPSFLFHVPRTRKETSRELYRQELGRLARHLIRLGGAPPQDDNLRRIMRDYQERRASNGSANGGQEKGVPLALVGSCGLKQDADLVRMIESAGGRIALDATGNGERTRPAPFSEKLLRRDPLGALVQSYFDHIPDAFRRPNDDLYEYLSETIRRRSIRGLIFRTYLWCDTWHAEEQAIQEHLSVPSLVIRSDGARGNTAQLQSRVEAFLEMLR